MNTKRSFATSCAVVMAAAILIAGCSSTTPAPESSATKRAIAKFDLGKCQVLEPNLYQCPTVDKPLCKPAFAKTDVVCVHVGENGELFEKTGM